MHFPGERTIRGLAERAVRPAVAIGARLGLPAIARRARAAGIEAHLARAAAISMPAEDLAWVRLHHRLSEPGGYFFSENLVSNESGFLAPAPVLERLPRGLAYLGVGPEQSFSYLALIGCSTAFVVDVRRDNARLHFLYRAIFEEATTRSEWLALLLGRPHDAAGDPGPGATIDAVIAHATRLAPTEASTRAARARLDARISRLPGLRLPGDGARVAALHRCFFRRQLAITFQLAGPRLRRYPTLRDQLEARDASGRQLGFLASEAAFRAVREAERGSRVLPVVGDLGGEVAVRAVGAEIRRRGEQVGAIYVSNVEQYLFERGTFARWVDNLRSLPLHPEAVLLRAYPEAEDGQPAPDAPRTLFAQLRRSASLAARAYARPGDRPLHVMPTIAHRIAPFLDRAETYRGFRELVCDVDLLAR